MLALLFICLNSFISDDPVYDRVEESSKSPDSLVRVINLNAYYLLQDDSSTSYALKLNCPQQSFYWYLKGNPPGVIIDAEKGILHFDPNKTYFEAGLLQYNKPYLVVLGIQDVLNPRQTLDTSFTVIFYNKRSSISKITPSISETIYAEEGDSIRFKLQCENLPFLTQKIAFIASVPINNYNAAQNCNDEFAWLIPYDFIKENDSLEEKELLLKFFTANTSLNGDTAVVRIVVKATIDYPLKYDQHKKISAEVGKYIQSLKLTFYVCNKNARTNKLARTLFDVTGSVTALTSSALPPSSEDGTYLQKVLPGIGLTLVPVKEALVPAKAQEKANANMVRTVAKKLEYTLTENRLTGIKDPEIASKIKNLQDELKQARLQLIEMPLIEYDENLSVEDAERYFRDYKVKKRQKLVME